jgi:hypothetical protein
MGSDGYVWGREFTSREPDSPRQLEIRKHWYSYMLWGRLGYDPNLDRSFWEQVIAQRFPQTDAAKLYDAWATASKIVPQVNRFHWRNWDFMWAVEGCIDARNGFHTVEDFIRTPTMERSGILSIPDYVAATAADRANNAVTPLDVADNLDRWADDSLGLVGELRELSDANRQKQLHHTLADIEAMSHLGRYYAAKIRGAVNLETSRRSNSELHRRAAVEQLTKAADHWRAYADVAGSLYKPQLLARTRRLDWNAIYEDVKRDIEIARDTTREP